MRGRPPVNVVLIATLLGLCGLLGGAVALFRAMPTEGFALSLPEISVATPVPETFALPVAPVITPEQIDSDVVARGYEDIATPASLPGGRPREIFRHVVQPGDTVFGLALRYGLTPETILWSNYGTLRDNPDLLGLGQELLIPPVDGLIYQVEDGDTLEAVARRFEIDQTRVVAEPINQLRDASQALQPGQTLFLPGGQRELVVWQLPKPVEVRRTASGIRVYRVGTCGEVEIPELGSGRFGWPTNRRYLSGYTFGRSHGGWDLAGRLGEPIYASDGGTVVYAGFSLGASGRPVGYGQYVVLDHGNGYRTLYAHASQLYVRCGQQVSRGEPIAAVGSVGKSTGPHLHFEIRFRDEYVNPNQFMVLERRP
jgi:murein DD-endopeptidase MepM/ murein hydrolase activator NlpD